MVGDGREPRTVHGSAGIFVAVLLTALAPAPSSAQILWDAPRMIGPESPGGFGVHWLRAGALPEDGDAVFATWALPGTNRSVTLRGGAGEGTNDELAGFGGIDLRATLARHDDQQPLPLGWNAGIGGSYGDYLVISAPVGISVGRSWSSGSVWFAPYLGLGAVLDYRRGDLAPDEEFAVEPSGEIGVDLAFDGARRFVIRAAASLGDRQAVSLGLALGGG